MMDPVTNPAVLNTDNAFRSCVRIICHIAAQERETEPLIEPCRISNFRVLRRSTRSASSNTAYEIAAESHKAPPWRRQFKRNYVACQKRIKPLYEDREHFPKEPHHFGQKPGSRMTTQTVLTEAPCLRTPTYPRAQREHELPSASTDIIPGSLLLSLAKKFVDLKVDWFGREPCVVDVILDLRNLIAEASRCVQDSRPHYRMHNFREGRTSLDTYWSNQAAILAESLYVIKNVRNMGFPESVERSTAT